MTLIGTSEQERWERLWRGYIPRWEVSDIIEFEINLIIRKYFPNEASLFLESGCGVAERSLLFIKENTFFIGVDFSREALRISSTLAKKLQKARNSAFVLADVRCLPFKPNCFDLSWNSGVIEHFAHKEGQQVINEMTRVTKRGGFIAIFVPNALSKYKVWKMLKVPWPYGLEEPYTPSKIEKSLAKAGLIILRRSGTHIFPFYSFLRGLGIKNMEKYFRVLKGLFKYTEWLNAFLGPAIFRLAQKPIHIMRNENFVSYARKQKIFL